MAQPTIKESTDTLPSMIRLALSFGLLLIVPVVLYAIDSSVDSPWLAYSYIRDSSLFEYFGFVGAVVLLVNIGIVRKQNKFKKEYDKVFQIFFAVFVFLQLIFFSELSRMGNDYQAYQESVRALLAGQSPYHSSFTASHPYIYPPLLAQGMAFIYRAVSWIWLHITSQGLKEVDAFSFLFYFFQYLQFCLTILSFTLSYLVARKFRIHPRSAAFLVFILFSVNLPLYRNFSQNQINLWILVGLLLAILWVQKRSFLSGLVIAIGAQLKLYPIIQVLPWILSKKWRAITGLFVTLSGIFLLETSGGKSLALWSDFLFYIQKVEKGVALRNNSIYSLSFNLSRLIFGNRVDPVNISTTILWIILTGLLTVWIFIRMYRRMQLKDACPEDQLIGNMMDAIFLMLFLSPSVWDHHLVAVIPVAIWAISKHPEKLLGSIGLALIFIFFLPTFDVFFFSYSRLAGLVLLLSSMPVEHESSQDEVDLFSAIRSHV